MEYLNVKSDKPISYKSVIAHTCYISFTPTINIINRHENLINLK